MWYLHLCVVCDIFSDLFAELCLARFRILDWENLMQARHPRESRAQLTFGRSASASITYQTIGIWKWVPLGVPLAPVETGSPLRSDKALGIFRSTSKRSPPPPASRERAHARARPPWQATAEDGENGLSREGFRAGRGNSRAMHCHPRFENRGVLAYFCKSQQISSTPYV